VALIRVGMAELKLGAPGDVLQALGLGSCIGLALVDRRSKLGGMVHVMLPDSAVAGDKEFPIGKFANTGVPELYEKLLKAGAMRTSLQVKMAGGAEMFAFAGKDAPRLSIGARNTEAVQQELKRLGMYIDAQDVGATFGRTFEVDLGTLAATIRVIGKPAYTI
jgi:chemotaxis protein CheD